jgi:hypothetical protein
MFLQTKFKNKLCSYVTILRVSLTRKKIKFYAIMLMPQKKRESLPPEKKVKILETDADAHKEK